MTVEHFRTAEARLHRALDCGRYGPERSLMLSLTAESFDRASLPEAAQRCRTAAGELSDADLLELQNELFFR